MRPGRAQHLMGLGMAFDLDKGAAAARVLPQFFMNAARIIAQIHIVKERGLMPRIPSGRCRLAAP